MVVVVLFAALGAPAAQGQDVSLPVAGVAQVHLPGDDEGPARAAQVTLRDDRGKRVGSLTFERTGKHLVVRGRVTRSGPGLGRRVTLCVEHAGGRRCESRKRRGDTTVKITDDVSFSSTVEAVLTCGRRSARITDG